MAIKTVPEPSQVSATCPTVSIVMAVYNTENYLLDALGSVLAQSYEDWELVAVENGSQDGSRSILYSFTDPRIRVIEIQDNIGITGAFNCGIEHARGRYIAILDSDDIALPDRLEKQVRFLNENPDVCLVGGRAMMFGEGMADELSPLFPPTHEDIIREFCDWNPIGHSTVMYKAEAVRAVGGYPSSFKYAQDCGLYLNLIDAGYRLANLPDVVNRCRLHPGQASAHPSWAVNRSKDSVAVFSHTRMFYGNSDRVVLRRNTVKLIDSYLKMTKALFLNAEYFQGGVAMWRAFKLGPIVALFHILTRVRERILDA